MSEIPELPARPVRTRPLPAGGLEAVVARGRRRRQRFLGTAGGATTGLVLLLAVALTSPGPTSDSLRQADPPPVPAVSVSAEPQQEPEASAGHREDSPPGAAAAPGASEQPGAAPTASPQPASGPQRPEEDPQPQAQPAREQYTEQPQDSASVACAPQPPSGQVGPVFTGGASACSTGSGGAGEVAQGGQVKGTYGYCVAAGDQPLVLGYATGQEHEVTVFDERTGELVHRFSETVDYPQGAHERTVPSNRCLSWTGTWDTTARDGQPASPGPYRVRISAVPSTAGGQPVERGEGGYVEFSVRVVPA